MQNFTPMNPFQPNQQTTGPFGQANNPFGQPNQQPNNPFGQQNNNPFAPKTNNPFNQPAGTTFGTPFGQASNPFGQTAPQQTPALGQFGQTIPQQTPTAGQFGQSNIFGQATQPTQSTSFGAASSFGSSVGSPFGAGTSGSAFGSTQPANQIGSGTSQPFSQNQLNPFSSGATFGKDQGTSTPFGSAINPLQPTQTLGQSQPTQLSAPSTNAFSQGSSTSFGQPSSVFGNSSTSFSFGQAGVKPAEQTNNSFLSQPAPSPFGQPQQSSPFGTSMSQTSASQPTGTVSSAFQQAPTMAQTASDFSAKPALGFGTAGPSTTQSSMAAASPFTFQGNTTPAISQTAMASDASAPKPQETSTPFSQAGSFSQPSAGTAAPQQTKTEPVDQSCLISSLKDNSVDLYNLTIQEIVDSFVAKLDQDVKNFIPDAQAVFERDMELIRAKKHYVDVQTKLEKEKTLANEISEMLDFLEKQLDELPVGDETEMARHCAEFEKLCDAFEKRMENSKDEQGEIMNLLNENYELIDIIDRKMDTLAGYSKK